MTPVISSGKYLSTFTQVHYLGTIVKHLYFYVDSMLLYNSGGECCTFYRTTTEYQYSNVEILHYE